jgi:methionine salvage enolase-phosphatase E1
MVLIYGVDTENKVTPDQVRDAIIECFYDAHQEVLKDMYVLLKESDINEKPNEIGKEYIKETVINYFIKVGGDFTKPTKEDILKVLDELKVFAEGFRSPEIVGKHYMEIMQLVEKL